MSFQSLTGVFDQTIKALALASLLYPLERIQSIMQIQPTYSNLDIKQHKSIISLSIHNGIKSYFRGYMPFISKLGLLNISMKVTQNSVKNHGEIKARQIIAFGISTVGYLITYPFEILNIRICAEIERERFYKNARQCMSKIKKNQGTKTFYRGFFWAYGIFSLQYGMIQMFQTRHKEIFSQMTQLNKLGTFFIAFAISELLLYPLTTLKKMYQINGAIGHNDEYYNIRASFKRSQLRNLWRGYGIRIFSLLSYSLLYCTFFDATNQITQR